MCLPQSADLDKVRLGGCGGRHLNTSNALKTILIHDVLEDLTAGRDGERGGCSCVMYDDILHHGTLV